MKQYINHVGLGEITGTTIQKTAITVSSVRAQIIGARGEEGLGRTTILPPTKVVIRRIAYVGALNFHNSNPVDDAPFSLKTKINKSAFNTLDNNFINSNLLNSPFAAPLDCRPALSAPSHCATAYSYPKNK